MPRPRVTMREYHGRIADALRPLAVGLGVLDEVEPWHDYPGSFYCGPDPAWEGPSAWAPIELTGEGVTLLGELVEPAARAYKTLWEMGSSELFEDGVDTHSLDAAIAAALFATVVFHAYGKGCCRVPVPGLWAVHDVVDALRGPYREALHALEKDKVHALTPVRTFHR